MKYVLCRAHFASQILRFLKQEDRAGFYVVSSHNTSIVGLSLVSFVLEVVIQICRTISNFTILCAMEVMLYIWGTENLEPIAERTNQNCYVMRTFLSVFLPSVCLCIYLFVCLSLFICLSVFLSLICLSIRLSVYLFVSIFWSVHLLTFLAVCFHIFLPTLTFIIFSLPYNLFILMKILFLPLFSAFISSAPIFMFFFFLYHYFIILPLLSIDIFAVTTWGLRYDTLHYCIIICERV
jgi:hypothetical protein